MGVAYRKTRAYKKNQKRGDNEKNIPLKATLRPQTRSPNGIIPPNGGELWR